MAQENINITEQELDASVCELQDIIPDDVNDYDIVVVGAGAAGVPAACKAAELGAKVALLQKESGAVSQGNCGSAIIKSRSTEAGIAKWIHHTNSLCSWRADTKLLRAYAEHSEEAMMWFLNRAGLTRETEYGDGSKVDDNKRSAELLNDGNGLCAFISTSGDFTGHWQDRENSYEYGDDHCYFWAPWVGPKPKNVGHALRNIIDNVQKAGAPLEVFYNTPAVQLVRENGRVCAVIAKNKEGRYIRYNAKKAVILATGDYTNNPAMVKRWCPDIADFDKKQFGKTGDGHILAISAGAVMEPLGHTKMMHDFDSALMFEEPFLYLNMEGERFTNEYTGFVYMGNILRTQPAYKGSMLDAEHRETGSKGWYCTVYDSTYMDWSDDEFVSGKVPPAVMEKFIPGAVENPQGVFKNLIDLHRCATLEELAKELDIPYDKLKASVDRYNELCDKGVDTDFGKPAKYMHKIEKAPFWGARKHIRVSAEVSGVITDENARALDADGRPIEGLYCVGNLGGQFYGGADYPFHQTGLSLGKCYTFGIIAAKHSVTGMV
ncbi:FAD-binding protein [Ruminococcus albus]|uniref:Fumarate reductase/succinate dehydrogenase flavoprotein domain protein n=1 Tax=Ruminococcus albus (strain ATCC 27210 / DSM 20455 / JCM 14654 / NCDO 2250 / 7) TaxID=697329 RepID=E6UCQ7_RUMA7|nr:FAD-binding protein [Ruminococcus albus]ADU22736.1 fumarate reductase/succinate dehydrogenase flavoprotein domain protein [Ruminococcus albus 7 = DSM 20455]